jgi:hypothetical protein
MMAILAGKLAARRKDCAPVAGKSTLNRLELSKLEPTRYHKIRAFMATTALSLPGRRGPIHTVIVQLYAQRHERERELLDHQRAELAYPLFDFGHCIYRNDRNVHGQCKCEQPCPRHLRPNHYHFHEHRHNAEPSVMPRRSGFARKTRPDRRRHAA